MLQLDTDDKKSKILKAAAEEFIEYGFYGARTKRIAEKAKVNKAMLHYYFSTKENIYKEVLNTVFNILIEKLNSIEANDIKENNVEEKMGQIIDVYINLFKNYSSYVKLLIYEIISGGKFLPQIIFENINRIPVNPMTGKLYKYFETQIKKGKIRKLNILQMLISLISQIMPVFLFQPIAENVLKKIGISNLVLEEFIRQRKKFIFDILKNGIYEKNMKRRK
jgi:hypothetical protein